MSTPEPELSQFPYACAVCGAGFGPNPRVERWLAGRMPLAELPKVNLCWVCTRLKASVDKEAAETVAYLGVCA